MEPLNSNWFIRARLKHRHLLVLSALGEYANLNHAAEVLGISQPAISKLLRELESGLDVQLFERQPRGVVPTIYGETMIRHARHLLKTLDNAFDEVNAIRQGLKGHVRLGSILTPCTDLIPETISRIRSAYPGLTVSIRTGASTELSELLKNGEVDIIVARHQHAYTPLNFCYEPMYRRRTFAHPEYPAPAYPARQGTDQAGFFMEPVYPEPAYPDPMYPEPVMICASPEHDLIRDGRRLSLADLMDQEWVMPPGDSIMRAEFESMFQRNGMRLPHHIVTAENLLMITSLMEQNAMLTLLPEAVMRHYARYQMMAQISVEPHLQRELTHILAPYGLIHKGENLLTPAAQAVLTMLRNARDYSCEDESVVKTTSL